LVILAEIMANSGHSIDSTAARAHVWAVGRKGGLINEFLAARKAGSPVSFTAWPAPRTATRFPFDGCRSGGRKAYGTLIASPERAPKALLADKGYDADAIRADLASRNIQAVIPGRSNGRVKVKYDQALYKQSNRNERMFGRLKINRAIATRYDQLAASFMSMVHIATVRYWLKFFHAV